MSSHNKFISNIVIVSLMSALVFLATYVTKIELSLFGNHTMIHFGNMICLIAAILFGRQCGALSGAIGMSLFDLVSGRFIIYFPFTFILKYVVGFVCGTIKSKNLNNINSNKLNCLAIFIALLINVIFSPLISLFIKVVLYDLNFYIAIVQTAYSLISSIINAILSGFLSFALLKILEPIMILNKH